MRLLLTRRETIALTVTLIFFCSILTPGQYLYNLDLFRRFIVNIFATMMFWGSSWFALGSVLARGLRYNLPWVWIEVVFYFPVTVIFTFILLTYVVPSKHFSDYVTQVLIINSIVLPAVIITVLPLQQRILDIFAKHSYDFPIWLPSPVSQCGLQSYLAPKLRGPIKRIEAENQYIRVFTSIGDDLVRLSLSEAESLLPQKIGLRIHRSHWIAHDEILKFGFKNGNPTIRTRSGVYLPVSRTMAKPVRALATAIGTESP